MLNCPKTTPVRRAASVATLTALGILAAGCSKTAGVADVAIIVTDTRARATPPGAVVGAAYLTLRNDGATADRLLSMETPIAGIVEIHSMEMTGGVMKMRQLQALDLPAKHTVKLAPGALHLMLLDLKQPLAAGKNFPMTLRFEKSAPLTTTVNVMPLGELE